MSPGEQRTRADGLPHRKVKLQRPCAARPWDGGRQASPCRWGPGCSRAGGEQERNSGSRQPPLCAAQAYTDAPPVLHWGPL